MHHERLRECIADTALQFERKPDLLHLPRGNVAEACQVLELFPRSPAQEALKRHRRAIETGREQFLPRLVEALGALSVGKHSAFPCRLKHFSAPGRGLQQHFSLFQQSTCDQARDGRVKTCRRKFRALA
jgi:hypothetical protein